MITKKLEEMVRRQSALTAKMIEGAATDAEKAELKTLTAAIAAATAPEPAQAVGKTTLRTVKLAAFKAEADAALAGQPTGAQLAVLKRNLAAVKDQGVTDPEGLVAVEVLVEPTEQEKMAALEQRVKDMEARLAEGFDGRTRTGLANPAAPDAAPAPPADGEDEEAKKKAAAAKAAAEAGSTDIAQQLATEAVDALIMRFTALKAKIASGALKVEDVHDAWKGDWELRSLIGGAAAVLAKLDVAAVLIKEVTPALEELDKKAKKPEAPAKADPPSNCPECNAPMLGKAVCPSCGWKFEGAEDKGKGTKKGDDEGEQGPWPRGDLAGEARNGVEQFRQLRKHRTVLSDK